MGQLLGELPGPCGPFGFDSGAVPMERCKAHEGKQGYPPSNACGILIAQAEKEGWGAYDGDKPASPPRSAPGCF
jgi:hypothetical protein